VLAVADRREVHLERLFGHSQIERVLRELVESLITFDE
jgi:hypothetical protein